MTELGWQDTHFTKYVPAIDGCLLYLVDRAGGDDGFSFLHGAKLLVKLVAGQGKTYENDRRGGSMGEVVAMGQFTPINFKQWIEENRHLLKPPVGNKLMYQDSEFIIMVVGGPNSRTDYHVDPGEEFFYQIEGDIVLKVIDRGEPVDVPIKEGEVFLLPPNIPHSPRRPARTIGLVIERTRRPDEKEGFVWYCEKCGEKLYEEFLHVSDIVSQLPPIFERFYNSEQNSTCKRCGTRTIRPDAKD